MNWKELAIESHYQTAVTIKQELVKGDVEEAQTGIDQLIEALEKSAKRALRSQLTRLMMHIIKWRIQPQHRSRSWLASISKARIEIDDLLEDEPSLRPNIHEIWDKCFKSAKQLAKDETGIEPTVDELSWEEVFEEEYVLTKDLQDELARELMEEIEWELRWDKTLADTQEQLDQLAEKALRKHREGKTEEMGFDEL